MNLKIKIKGREYNVSVEDLADTVVVNIDGNEYVFDANGNGKAQKENSGFVKPASIAPKNSKQIKAPLSGVISEISIEPNSLIKVAQKLLTLSAMKMENEILAETQGKVKEILVKKGQAVREGDLLIILE
ncbi:MAG: biotin/lipoyl-containing protein [Candidatus Paceibacterota bacterium]